MSKFVVKNGTLSVSGTSISSLELNNVTVDATAAVHNYEVMGEAWLVQTGGVKSWSASAETAYDTAIGIDLTNTIGESGTLSFDTVDGKTLSGTVIIESASVSAPVDGYATVSWSFQGSSALGEA